MGQLILIEKWAENLDEATVSRWLKREGERVEAGDSLCEIITDKATFEYEVEEAGVLLSIYAPRKSTVPVGYVIAFIGEVCEEPPEGIEERNAALVAEHRAQADLELELGLPGPRARAREPHPRVRATPAARRLARRRDLHIEEIAQALAIEGVVSEEDVERFLQTRDRQ